MKLYLNTASPFARLARVLLIETKLDGDVELVFIDPWKADGNLLAANPAAKIPVLALDGGTNLVESACIADYLIHLSGSERLSPMAGANTAQRVEVLGLARAAMDCAFGSVIQERFSPASPLIVRWLAALPRIADRLDALYAEIPGDAECDLGDLTTAVALDYVDFRLGNLDWTYGRPYLTERVKALGKRASLATTRPE